MYPHLIETDLDTILLWIQLLKCVIFVFIILRHTKSGGVICYTGPSVCQSVSASFPDSNVSIFDRFFSKFAWTLTSGWSGFGIANGLNLLINNRVMALD